MLFFKFVLKKRAIDDRIYKNGKEWRINMIKNRLAKAATVAVLICTVFTALFLMTGCSSSKETETDTNVPDDVKTGGNFYYSDLEGGSGEVVIRGIVNPRAIGKTLEIPRAIGSKKVVAIGDDAFNSMDRLTAIALPDTIKTIGKQAFYNCDNLTEIVIPATVTSVGEGAFDSCDRLKTVEYQSGSNIKTIERRTFNECIALESIKLPSSLKTIGEYAFCDNEALTEIDIPNNVETISSYAFCACNNLVEIFIPLGVENMGEHVFQGCKSLTIYTGVGKAPETWDSSWNSSGCKVEWKG